MSEHRAPRRCFSYAEKEVGDITYAYLVDKYGKTAVEDHRNKFGPDFRVSPNQTRTFLVDCKRSQPDKRAGNGVPDRAVGQIVRYQRGTGLPVFLVVPDDWRKERSQGGGSGKSWKTQVEESLRFVRLSGKIKVVCLGEMKSRL